MELAMVAFGVSVFYNKKWGLSFSFVSLSGAVFRFAIHTLANPPLPMIRMGEYILLISLVHSGGVGGDAVELTMVSFGFWIVLKK